MSCFFGCVKWAVTKCSKKRNEEQKTDKQAKKKQKEKQKKYECLDAICGIDENNRPSIGVQSDCCVCFENINEPLLKCGHNVHVSCIIKSRKPVCPLCDVNVIEQCKEHMKKCGNQNCICKLETPLTKEIKLNLAHDLITYYMSEKNYDIAILKVALENIGIKNPDEIIENYELL